MTLNELGVLKNNGGEKTIDIPSNISTFISIFAGAFFGHMIYDICKTHKPHKGNKKEEVGKNIENHVNK